MKKLILSLAAFFAVFLSIASFSFAQTVQSGQQLVNLSKDKIINSDYFVTGKEVIVSGTVNGDSYVAGGNVTFDGVVNGDLLVAGGNVKILGVIHGNVRTAGGNVQIEGTVDKNVTALGGTININRDAKVAGSLTGAGGTINIDTALGKGATIAGGNLTINSKVNGNVMAGVAQLNLTDNAVVTGDLTYMSRKELLKTDNSQVLGKITHNIPPQKEKPNTQGSKFGFGIFAFLTSLFMGSIFIYFFPRFTGKISDRICNKFIPSFLWGLLFLVAVPIVGVILLITLIGIPFAILLFVAYIFLLCFGQILSGLAIGDWLGKRFKFSKNRYVLLAIGLLILGLAQIVPVVGGMIGFFAVTAGFGAYLLTEKEFFLELQNKKLL